MGSDRARNTFDRTKQYRRLIAQQGRVELEADKNESAEIATETLRLETIDMIGPYGVPSDPVTDTKGTGYQIAPLGPQAKRAAAAARDFRILPGTIYLGGWRIEQENQGLTYEGQASNEWLEPHAVEAAVDVRTTLESVVLHVSEHEVSAVEDSTLREVALGGPDTAQRMRLTRHVGRFAVSKPSCDGAFAQVVELMAQRGFSFDKSTMALESGATLLVKPYVVQQDPNPCDPVAKGGYLGAENQMIRVQLAQPQAQLQPPPVPKPPPQPAPNPLPQPAPLPQPVGGVPVHVLPRAARVGAASPTAQLLWAYDDASDLYLVTPRASNSRALELGAPPVDAQHWPKAQQVVEVLAAAAKLGNDGYEAADAGPVYRLGADYDPDTNTVMLDGDLDADLLDAPALFLRVWQNLQSFTPDEAVSLVDRNGTEIGLHVTVGGAVTAWQWHAGEFWSFSVRPGFPQDVFPARFADVAQPPDGPRQWMAPLACINWNDKSPITDCRPDFDDLVQLTAEIDQLDGGGCCTVRVKPTDAPNLQAIVDKYSRQVGVTICFAPGLYRLTAPLHLNKQHSEMTLEGAEGPVTLLPSPETLDQFQQGLIEITDAVGITLRNLNFELVEVPLPAKQLPPDIVEALGDNFPVAFGVRPFNSRLRIERCSFSFPGKNDGAVLGAGIFAGGDVSLEVCESTFIGTRGAIAGKSDLFGILLAPTVTYELRNGRVIKGATIAARLARATIENNDFSRLRAAALVAGSYGQVHIEDNDVSSSYVGFALTVPEAWSGSKDFAQLGGDQLYLAAMVEALDADSFLRPALTLASVYPIPSGAAAPPRIQLPPLEKGKTYEALAAAVALDLRKKLVDVARAPVAPKKAAAQAKAAAASLEADLLTARDAVAVPAEVAASSQNVSTVLVNIAALRPVYTTLQFANGSISVSNNNIDLGASGVASRYAVIVFDPGSDVVVSANRATNICTFVPTMLLVAKRTAVTGNVVVNYATATVATNAKVSILDHTRQVLEDLNLVGHLNEVIALRRTSLVVIPFSNDNQSDTVITGNLCEGIMLVPARPDAKAPTWRQLNTEVL